MSSWLPPASAPPPRHCSVAAGLPLKAAIEAAARSRTWSQIGGGLPCGVAGTTLGLPCCAPQPNPRTRSHRAQSRAVHRGTKLNSTRREAVRLHKCSKAGLAHLRRALRVAAALRGVAAALRLRMGAGAGVRAEKKNSLVSGLSLKSQAPLRACSSCCTRGPALGISVRRRASSGSAPKGLSEATDCWCRRPPDAPPEAGAAAGVSADSRRCTNARNEELRPAVLRGEGRSERALNSHCHYAGRERRGAVVPRLRHQRLYAAQVRKAG